MLSSILSLLPGRRLLPKMLPRVSILHVRPIVCKTVPLDYPTSYSNSTHLTLNSTRSSFSPQLQQTPPAPATRSWQLGNSCPYQVSETKHLGVTGTPPLSPKLSNCWRLYSPNTFNMCPSSIPIHMALIPGLTPVSWTPYGACHLLISPEATLLTVMLPYDPGQHAWTLLEAPSPRLYLQAKSQGPQPGSQSCSDLRLVCLCPCT